jgi:hypothetical protein
VIVPQLDVAASKVTVPELDADPPEAEPNAIDFLPYADPEVVTSSVNVPASKLVAALPDVFTNKPRYTVVGAVQEAVPNA